MTYNLSDLTPEEVARISACYTEQGQPLRCPVCESDDIYWTVVDRLDNLVMAKACYCNACNSGEMIGFWEVGSYDAEFRPDVALRMMHDTEAHFAAVTDDWVACFSQPENQNGFMWRMAAQGVFPQGVNPDDPRVAALRAKAALDNGMLVGPGTLIVDAGNTDNE